MIDINDFTRHYLIIRHNDLNDINHQIKVMRHKYVAQFCTTETYNLILEGHIFSYTRIRFKPPFRTSQEWVFSIYCRVITIQLYHLDSTLCRGVGVYSNPSATWRSWTQPYCVTPAGGTRWVNVCSMNVCVCFQISVFRGVTLGWHGSHQTLYQNIYTAHLGTVFGIPASTTCRLDPCARPFQAWQQLSHRRTPKHALLCWPSCRVLKPVWASLLISQYSGLRARVLGASHSAKGFSSRVASAPVDCHLNCWRAETTTSFNFKVFSALHSLHSVSCSCSSTLNLKLLSDSKTLVSAAFTMLKKTSWSCHTLSNACQIKVSLHRTSYFLLTGHLSAHIFSIIRWCLNCGLCHHNPLT